MHEHGWLHGHEWLHMRAWSRVIKWVEERCTQSWRWNWNWLTATLPRCSAIITTWRHIWRWYEWWWRYVRDIVEAVWVREEVASSRIKTPVALLVASRIMLSRIAI